MIPKEQAQKYLKSKSKKQSLKIKLPGFSGKYVNLARIILTDKELYKKVNIYNTEAFQEKSKQEYILNFGDDWEQNPFASPEGRKLARKLFGEYLAPYIKDMWDIIDETPYQTGYYRRSFRAKSKKFYLKKKLQVLQNLYNQQLENSAFFNMPLPDVIRYMTYAPLLLGFEHILAAAIDRSGEELRQIVIDIFNGEDETGGITRTLIKAMLLSKNPANWEEVGKLLLAAQRQEGLRQSILESLDETSRGAFKYMIQLIADNNLHRFSSVVRAVDVWFGFDWKAPKKNVINKIINQVILHFNEPESMQQAFNSANNLEVYVALWANAVLSGVENSLVKTMKLLDGDKPEKRLLALLFIKEAAIHFEEFHAWVRENFGKYDLLTDYLMLQAVQGKFHFSREFLQKMIERAKEVPAKGKVYKAGVFEWTDITVRRDFFYELIVRHASGDTLQYLADHISAIPADARYEYIRKIFPDYATWVHEGISDKYKKLNLPPGDWRYTLLHNAVFDRSIAVSATALRAMIANGTGEPELEVIKKLFTRKSKSLQAGLIKHILSLPKNRIRNMVNDLAVSSNQQQRLAALEILLQLKDKASWKNFVRQQTQIFKSREKLTGTEQMYLQNFEGDAPEYNFSNGFGVIDFDNMQDLYIPEKKLLKNSDIFEHVLAKISAKRIYKGFINFAKINKALDDLTDIYVKNAGYEYFYTGYDGRWDSLLLSQSISPAVHTTAEMLWRGEHFEAFPLASQWKDWYEKHRLNDYELFMAYIATRREAYYETALKKYTRAYKPVFSSSKLKKAEAKVENIRYLLNNLLYYLLYAFADMQMIDRFILDVYETMIADLPVSIRMLKWKNKYWGKKDTHWTDVISPPGDYLLANNIEQEDISLQKRYWDVMRYLYYEKLRQNKKLNLHEALRKMSPGRYFDVKPDIIIKLFNENKINEDDLLYTCLSQRDMISYLEKQHHQKMPGAEKIPWDSYNLMKERMLEIELKRAEADTEVTDYVTDFQYVKGMRFLFKALELLGKESLKRDIYFYAFDRNASLSRIVNISQPAETDTYEAFAEKAAELNLSKKRWLEVAMYAPQWADWIGRMLKINALEDAVWWFHAHVTGYYNTGKETVIAQYTQIEAADFARGALDIDWFNKVYPVLGKTNWSMLNNVAKYVSEGNGHRLVKLYSSAMTGEVKITETLKKIKDKRDKDYVKILGVIPLSRRSPGKDLLKRYNLLQEFLKESKQFGQQRQESEKEAVEIALDNLARTAGYTDTIQFILAMEANATQQILENSEVKFEDAIIRLAVDEHGKPEIKVEKNGKQQKSIPAKYKKHKEIKRLRDGKAYLRKQYSRTRKFLEDAMMREQVFTMEDIQNLMEHPVARPMLQKLVLYFKDLNLTGLLTSKGLVNVYGEPVKLDEDATCVIAHPAHLYQTVEWDLYQKYAFENKLVQPFKQIFRELYLLMADEREKATLSERYQGHQIQPKKAVALLRSRGWTVHYDEGLQKVFHRKNYIATLYAMADWFTPSDVEAPTLEYVAFESRKDYKRIPLTEIDPVTFSEVMRDIDLVVSVAHVGGVDPEASHSTMEMRAAIARETAALFKYKHVEIKERHIVIQGKLGTYSIHLGSGNVSKNGLYLSIIPVHSQHRGRMFLPFVDDDPKTAEIISKMKLLAEDDKIKDPSILAQINAV